MHNAITIIHQDLATAITIAAPLIRDGAQVARCIHRDGAWRISISLRNATEATQEAQT